MSVYYSKDKVFDSSSWMDDYFRHCPALPWHLVNSEAHLLSNFLFSSGMYTCGFPGRAIDVPFDDRDGVMEQCWAVGVKLADLPKPFESYHKVKVRF